MWSKMKSLSFQNDIKNCLYKNLSNETNPTVKNKCEPT